MTNLFIHGTAVHQVPSRIAVARTASGVMVGIGAVAWIASVDRFDGRHLVGLLATVLLTGALFARFVDQATQRHVARLWADVETGHQCPNCPDGYDCESGDYFTIPSVPDQGSDPVDQDVTRYLDEELDPDGHPRWLAVPASGVDIDEYGRERDEAWLAYHDNHPEVITLPLDYGSRWPRCTCRACDPAGFRSVTA